MEYKGIYYGDNKVRKFYEYGAHFSYLELCKKLERLILNNENKIRNRSNENFNKYIYMNDNSKNIILSRNNNILYYNNPNSQDLNFDKTMHIIKTRKKSENLNSNESNYGNNNYELYKRIQKNNLEKKQIKENIINDIQNNKSNKTKIINYIYKQNEENYNKHLNKNLNNINKSINNNNYIHYKFNSFDNNNPQNNLIHTNYNKSRNNNFNNNLNYLKSVEDKINNILTSSRDKNHYNNDVLFYKTMYKNEKLMSPIFHKKKINNINLPSSKYINKDFINYKIHPIKFSSGVYIFNKNIEHIHNYNIYK